MKQTEERHSESRMQEICSSGLMRGKEVGGHWPCASHAVASLPTLSDSFLIFRFFRVFYRPQKDIVYIAHVMRG